MIEEMDFTMTAPESNGSPSKKQITIRIDEETIDYFKQLSAQSGVPYQNLINMFLRDCAAAKRKPVVLWS